SARVTLVLVVTAVATNVGAFGSHRIRAVGCRVRDRAIVGGADAATRRGHGDVDLVGRTAEIDVGDLSSASGGRVASRVDLGLVGTRTSSSHEENFELGHLGGWGEDVVHAVRVAELTDTGFDEHAIETGLTGCGHGWGGPEEE